MKFIGEHLLPGQLGHFFTVLALVASLVAAIAYFKSASATLSEVQQGWKKLARIAFAVDCFSVLAVFASIFYIVSTHKFEYTFAWNHSSKNLNFGYLFACIWEAQEGSFLLWTIWHCVLGTALILRAGKWEAPVMAVVSIMQVCLATMIIGIYLGETKIGINPFLLVRQLENMRSAPIFSRPDYLSIPMMQDGLGLNQLLQNYWMVIHPPVLFLGFASTIVPFAYAIAGLWKRDYAGWTKAALPWTIFSAGILGLGIMMGAAWAYESLTFGGFWAWDPVENASLVPWLVLVAGLHTQVVYNATGHSLRATYLFFIVAFFLVLFSTFLTRSGILGDSSVHAFVENEMNLQLISLMAIFLLPSLFLFAKRFKEIPHIAKEESSYSREFWMFIGALVLFLAAIVITWQTSFTPIYNKLAGKTTAAPEDPEFAYNKIQVFVAVVLGLLTGIGQFLRYKDTPKAFLKKAWLPLVLALGCSVLISVFGNINYQKHGAGFLAAIHLAVFAAVYAVIGNASYIWTGLNGKLKVAGGSIAHLGFGLMLLGILFSSAKKDVLSKNNGILLNFDPKSKQDPLENLTLIKGLRSDMGNYWATYIDNDSVSNHGTISYYRVDFEQKKTGEKFTLYPNLIKNTKGAEGFSNNPDSRHYWDRDIFTYVTYASSMDRSPDTVQFRKYQVKPKDTIFYSHGYMILNKVSLNPTDTRLTIGPSDTMIVADISVVSADSMRYRATPAIFWKGVDSRFIFDTVFAQNLAIGFTAVNNETHGVELQVKESDRMSSFIALKAYEFPHINLLWLGTILMTVGFAVSMRRRQVLNKSLKLNKGVV